MGLFHFEEIILTSGFACLGLLSTAVFYQQFADYYVGFD